MTLDDYRIAWETEKRKLDALLADSKNTPPNNYWQAEWAARRKYEAAKIVAEIVNG